MKIRKQFIFIVLILAFALGVSVPVLSAAGNTGYSDVDTDASYAEAVAWCREQGLMYGTGEDTFSPDATLTRATVATVLYRAAGEPAVSEDPAFDDTPAGQWYSNAVTWVSAQGLIVGYGNGLYGTNDSITREQLDVIFRRYQGESPIFTGDPALAVPATRAEAAVAFYNGLKESEGLTDPTQESKVLVAYFSATNTTKSLAEYVADSLNAGLYEIVPETPYTSADLNYGDSSSRTTTEQNDPNARPAISGSVDNMEQYDVIFLGYPIWWGQAPKIISTFLESYDLSGKTIVPFCTSGSSPIGSSATNLHSLANGATWLDGQRFSGGTSRDTMVEWINGLGLNVTAS